MASSRSRQLYAPALTLLVLLLPLGWYLLVRVPQRTSYLTGRNQRELAELGSRLSDRASEYASVLDKTLAKRVGQTPSDSRETTPLSDEQFVQGYFKALVPDLRFVRIEHCKPARKCMLGALETLDVRQEGGDAWVYLKYNTLGHKLEAKASLRSLLERYLTRDIFDDVLLVRQDGAVLFQRAASGPRLGRLQTAGRTSENSLFALQPPGRAAESLETEIGGDSYQVFLQPVPLPGAPDGSFALCGLVRRARFMAERLQVSYNALMLGFLLLLAPFVSWPCLRLFSSNPLASWGPRQGVALVVSLWICASLLAFLGLTLYTWYALGEQTDAQLKSLAEEIDRRFAADLRRMQEQLQAFDASSTLQREVENLAGHGQLGNCESRQYDAKGRPVGIYRSSILERKCSPDPDGAPTLYLSLDDAAWIDDNGQQRIKWSREAEVSNLADVRHRDYFQRPGYVQMVHSVNTGKNQLVLSLPSRRRPGVSVATLSARPAAVMGTLLPPDFGFAVVDHAGKVQLHSAETRNLRENFFEESDWSWPLEAAVRNRAGGVYVAAAYQGARHRMYVRPLAAVRDQDWFLIVFRDKAVAATMNLELVTVAAALFVLYTVVLLLAVWGFHRLARGELPPRWFWPSRRLAAAYFRLSVFCAACLLISILWILFLPRGLALAGAVLLPILAVGGAAFLLRTGGTSQPGSAVWRTAYAGAAALLLLLLSLVPALGFIKVAYDFELGLTMKHAQLRLARSLEGHVDPTGLYWGQFFSFQFPVPLPPPGRPQPEDSVLSGFLGFLRPAYNALAEDLGAAGRYQPDKRIRFEAAPLNPFRHGAGWAVLVSIAGLVFLLCALVAPRVFLLQPGAAPNPKGPLVTPAAVSSHVLVVAPRVPELRRPWEPSEPFYRIDLAEVAARNGWAAAAAAARYGSAPVVVLDRFEHKMDEEQADAQKLLLLDQLLASGKRLYVFSILDPWARLPRKEWAAALSSFWRVEPESGPGPADPAVAAKLLRKVVPDGNVDLGAVFQRECGATAALQVIGAELVEALGTGVRLGQQDLIRLVLDRAAAYYAGLWEGCSTAERLVLLQLAQDRIVSPRHRDTIRRLWEKHLLRQDPLDPNAPLELMNDSFARFLTSPLCGQESLAAAADASRAWASFKWVYLTLLVSAGLFVLITQREAVQPWIGYVTGLLTAIGTASKLFSSALAPNGPSKGHTA